ncbi:MAG: ATP-binding protein [Vicinamibacterales bacterium]
MRLGVASFTLHVRSAMEAIGPASEQAESWLATQRVSSDAASLVSLAIEELVTNCIKYDYDDSNDHTVDIVLSVDDGALTVEGAIVGNNLADHDQPDCG